MRAYWRSNYLDVLLCFLTAAGLAVNVFTGYDSPDPLTASPAAIGGVVLVCTVLLFLAGYNRATMLTGIGAGLLLVIAAAAAVRSGGILTESVTIDESPALFWLVTVGTAVLTYLLSRSRLGLVVLTMAGTTMAAAFCFLEYPVQLTAYLLFLAAALTSFLYRVYRSSLLQSERGAVRLKGYTVQSAVLVVLAMLISGGIYMGIVRPLAPPTQELKLITRLQSFEILERLGISKKTEIQSQDNTTQERNDQTETSKDKTQEDEDTAPQPTLDPTQENDMIQQMESVQAEAISYWRERPAWAALILFLVILIVASPFLVKYWLRRRWERCVQQGTPAEQCRLIYDDLIRKLRYAGFRRPDGVTLLEYVQGNAERLAPFAEEGTDFLWMTERYQKVVYGCQVLNEDDAAVFWRIYRNFRGNFRKTMGTGRYLLRFYAL